MFQPETEDMMPRMAPKPSSDAPNGASEGIIRPQVPEISILFGQQHANLQQYGFNTAAQQQNTNVSQQTYASWKKQMLPKVTYPPSANVADMQVQENNMMHGYNFPLTNLYPIRSNINPSLNVPTNVNTNASGVGNCGVGVGSQLTYRRSLESCNKMVYQQMPTLQPQHPLGTMNHLPNTGSGEVLTICAGTQTDAILESKYNYLEHVSPESCPNLASKKDIEDVRQILDDFKVEQQRMLKMLETILLSNYSQIPVKTHYRDVGVQVDSKQSDNPYGSGEIGTFQDQSVPKNKFLQHLKPTANISQTPKGKPMAQSTTYRPNSPQPLKQDFLDLASSPIYQQSSSKPTPIIPKSASDTTMAMNELALKYLPNEKLTELLKELNMNCPLDTDATNAPTTPDRANKDIFEKGPSDISNASYKYLKKYRLLPEDHEENGNIVNNKNEEVMENGNNQIPQYNSPQYNNIRNTPINQKPTLTNRCSPYAGRLPLSPLARAPSPSLQSTVPQHIVNLENIKHQPKFL